MTVDSDLCRITGVPLKIPPLLGVQRIFPLDPKSGVFWGAPVLLHKSESIFIENTPHIS